MKLINPFHLIILIIILVCPIVLHGQSYSWPESAVYDAPNDRYLISNMGSGDIISVPRTNPTNLGIFVLGTNTGYPSMRGIIIIGNTLWGACTKNDNPTWTQVLVGYDMATKEVTDTITIPGGSFINDVTSDPSGIIYLSDDNNIYRVDPATGTVTILLANAGANGLLYEADKNRLLYTDDSPIVGSQISAIDMTTNGMSPLFINPGGVQFLDGLTKDHMGNYYVSEWSFPHEIYRYDPNLSSIELASSGHNGVAHAGAADIFFDQANKILVVPNMNGGTPPNNFGTLDLIPFSQLSTLDSEVGIPTNFQLHQNFPNPFNPNTTIFYDVSKESNVKVTVFDLLGREIIKLVDQVEPTSRRSINWDGRDNAGNLVNAGVYIYQIEADGYIQTKKMVLLK